MTGESIDAAVANAQLARLKQETRPWHHATLRWQGLYFITAGLLIVLPIIVAAEGSLTGSGLAWLLPYLPGVALVVAVLAAIQTALNPGHRWKAFHFDRERARELIATLTDFPPKDRAEYDAYGVQINKLLEDHRKNLA